MLTRKQRWRCMPAPRRRAIASTRAMRIPTHRTAHQRVRRDALTRTLAGVHLRLPHPCTIPFCALLLQHLHSHITTPTFQPKPTDAAPRPRHRPSSSPRSIATLIVNIFTVGQRHAVFSPDPFIMDPNRP